MTDSLKFTMSYFYHNVHRFILFLCFSCALQVSNPPTTWAQGEDEVSIQFMNTPISYILLEYEKLTGKKIIRDANAEGATLSIETTGKMSPQEAARFIEKSLLLNGYALLPAGDNTIKMIAFEAGKQPRGEGAAVITNPADLPAGDEVVTYIMPLQYLSPEEAARTFSQIASLHSYGVIAPVPDAGVVVITENSSTIRSLLALQESLDVPASETTQQSFQLIRSDAEEVAESLREILGISNGSGRSNGQNRNNRRAGPQPSPNNPSAANASGGGGKIDPRIQAIARTNRILVVARPVDMRYIESLILEYDGAAASRNSISRQLRYMSVLDILPIAEDVLLRGENTGSNNQRNNRGGFANNRNNNNRGNQFGNSTTGGNLNRGASLEERETGSPESLLIGKTLLIADPASNEIFASGPPEHLRTLNEIIDQLDQRPRQIFLSIVIGQLTLGDDFNMGIDFLRRVDDVKFAEGSLAAGSLRTSTDGGGTFPSLGSLVDNAAFPGAAGLSIYGQIGPFLDTYLNTLQSTNRFTVLSRPSIFTVNNKKAVVATGQRIAVPVSTISSLDGSNNNLNNAVTSNIEYRDVVLKLEVVPLINSNDEVTLEISQVNDDIVGSTTVGGNEIPTIGTQEMVTTVIVPDKSTVLLGGLVTDRDNESQRGLPILNKIPILKHLTGTSSDNQSRQELVIFIQPHIINDPSDLPDPMLDAHQRTEVAQKAFDFANPPGRDRHDLHNAPAQAPNPTYRVNQLVGKKKPKARLAPPHKINRIQNQPEPRVASRENRESRVSRNSRVETQILAAEPIQTGALKQESALKLNQRRRFIPGK